MARKKTSAWKDQRHTLEQRRDAIQHLMDEAKQKTSPDLCRQISTLKSDKERLELELQNLSEQLEAVGQVLADRWGEEGISSMDVEGLGTFSVQTRLYVSAKDKAAYHEWLRANGLEVLIQQTVAPKTTEALVRERLENGQPCGEEMGLNIHYKMTVR